MIVPSLKHSPKIINDTLLSYMTNSRLVSDRASQHMMVFEHNRVRLLTKWVTTGELRLLSIASSQFVTNAVEKLHVALLRFLLECCNEGPRHGAGRLRRDRSIRSRK